MYAENPYPLAERRVLAIQLVQRQLLGTVSNNVNHIARVDGEDPGARVLARLAWRITTHRRTRCRR